MRIRQLRLRLVGVIEDAVGAAASKSNHRQARAGQVRRPSARPQSNLSSVGSPVGLGARRSVGTTFVITTTIVVLALVAGAEK
jgi:hypothetical protein